MATYGVSTYGTAGSTYGVAGYPWPQLRIYIGTTIDLTMFIIEDDDLGVLDQNTLGDTLRYAWVEVTNDVIDQGVTISRGSSRNQGPYFRYEAGRVSFKLNNRTGDYDPSNMAGRFVIGGVTQLRPSLPVLVKAYYDGDYYVLFTGYVDKWEVTYPSVGTTVSYTDVSAVDGVGVLTAADPLESPEQGSGDTVVERIERVVDNVSWETDARDFQSTDLSTFLPTTLAQSAWSEIQLAADSVNGYLYLDRYGVLTYRSKAMFPRSPSLLFGDGGIPVLDAMISNDPSQIYNVVKMAQAGGSQVNIQDEASISLYGMRTYSRTDLQVQSEEDVYNAAEYVLSQYGTIQLRVEQMKVELDDSSDRATWRQLLELEMLQRTRLSYVTTDGRSIERDGLVRGYQLRISSRSWSWDVSTGQIPNRLGEFTLDNTLLGVVSRWASNDDIRLAYAWRRMVAYYGAAQARVLWLLGEGFGGPAFASDFDHFEWAYGVDTGFVDRTLWVFYQKVNTGTVYTPFPETDFPVDTDEPVYPELEGTVNVPTLLDRYQRLAAF